jgi:hypothetical protein
LNIDKFDIAAGKSESPGLLHYLRKARIKIRSMAGFILKSMQNPSQAIKKRIALPFVVEVMILRHFDKTKIRLMPIIQ